MNLILMLAILITNIVAVGLVFQFVKRDDRRSQILFIAISFGIIYIAVSIAYAISGIGIDKSVNEAAKNYITFLFVPIDVILLVPFVATKYVKYKAKKISKKELVKRIITISIIGLVVLAGECAYFKSMKQNMKTINNNLEQTNQSDTETKNNEITNNKTTNVIVTTDNKNEIEFYTNKI